MLSYIMKRLYRLKMSINENIVIGLVLVCLSHWTAARKCEDPEFRQQQSYEIQTSNSIDKLKLPQEYICPREFDPKTFTECCWDGGCCEGKVSPISQIDEWLMMVIAIIVITLCTILALVVVICCFWSKCPFYNTCRMNYNMSDVIVYHLAKEDDPLSLMPVEENTNNKYIPVNVKIKPVEEV